MSKVKLMTDNKAIDATYSLLSGVENAQFELTNINETFTTKVFRSTGTSCIIQVDLGASHTIDTMCLVGHNIDGLGITGATIEFSPTTSFSGTSIETIAINADNNFGYVEFTEGSYRYAKITLTATSYCELSSIYIGNKTEIPNNNIDVNSFKWALKENFKAKKNNYGQLFIDTYNTVNSLSGAIKYVNKSELEILTNLYAETGNTTPIWVILDSDNDLHTEGEFIFSGYFYLSGSLNFKSVGPGLWDTSLTFVEVV